MANSTRTTSLDLNTELFWQPSMKGLDVVRVPMYCFLVSNGDRHILFDLGLRSDWKNCAPKTVDLIHRTTKCYTNQNIVEILDAHSSSAVGDSSSSVQSTDIEAIIWSHHHFDHIGDPSTFPKSTALVVGPGVSKLCWPGYPKNQDGVVLDVDAEGRVVHEIDFTAHPLRVGGFDAFDYFGDGSFYLLDAPGHSVGHMTALARVTANETGDDSFLFMGADACHHPGILRPTAYLPLPAQVRLPSLQDDSDSEVCGVKVYPGEALQQLHRNKSATQPFFELSSVMLSDAAAAQETVRKICELDAADNILVILAHDGSLRGHIDFFPHGINAWRVEGIKHATRWLFCKDFLIHALPPRKVDDDIIYGSQDGLPI